jgi:DNA-binding beta-propeller fold protein YncE
MGIVYRALQLDLERTVALKLIASQLAEDQDFRDRFMRESRAAASIDHPNVIPIFYTGEHEGALYIAMRYVEGSDLRTLVRAEGRLAPERAARIVRQVGAALDAAHARGIVHRDVKPANVLLGPDDHAYLTDFGLTKRLHSLTASTRSGGWVGTLGYVAPEQIRGERVDARSDVYALGCVLYHSVAGAPPYQRDSDEATLWAHLNDPPAPLRDTVAHVPPGLDAVLRRALAKTPDDRFQSAGDLGRAALAAIAGEEAPTVAERRVAVGPAAPVEEETIASPEAPTLRAPASPAETADAGTGVTTAAERGRRRGWTIAAAAIPVLALAILAVNLLSGNGNGNRGNGSARDPATTPPDTTPAPARAPAGTVPANGKIKVGGRPNDVVATGKLIWVVRHPIDTLATILPSGRRAAAAPRVGGAASSAAAGFGHLWVADDAAKALVPIGLGSHRQDGAAIPLPSQGPVVAVATGERGVWVGIRSRPGLIVRVDPLGRTIQKTVEVPDGVQDIAVGAGAVWVVGRYANAVTRVDVASGQQERIFVGGNPAGIAVGGDAVWVANSRDRTVTRIDPGSLGTSTIRVGDTPTGVAVGGGSVWVANRLDNTLTRIDTATRKRVGSPVEVDTNPYAVDVRGGHVWVTSPPSGTVTRVDFGR